MRGAQRWSTVVAALLFIGGCDGGECPGGSLRVENQCLQIEGADCAEPVALYRDVDEDGFGDPSDVAAGCSKTGYVPRGGDCDDTAPTIHPEAPEQCNEVDDDCDGVVDDEPETLSWYADLDGDGFGNEGAVIESCLQPEGTVPNALDCDDGNDAVSPVGQEACNGLDESCSGAPDDGPLMECAVGERVECTTECGSLSETFCTNDCRIDSCPPPAESCTLADDDCDGIVDNAVSALVDLGSRPLPTFLSPTATVHTMKAVSTNNGIVLFVLMQTQTQYRLWAYRLSDDGKVVQGPVLTLVRDYQISFGGGPLDVAVASEAAYVAMPPNGQGLELVRVSLVDLREVDSVGPPLDIAFQIWKSHCVGATESGVVWAHRLTGVGSPSIDTFVQFYSPSLEEGQGHPLRSGKGDGSDAPECVVAPATGLQEGKWVVAYDASPYLEVALVQEDIGEVSAVSYARGSGEMRLYMLRDPTGDFVVVGRDANWDVWRYSLGVDLELEEVRLGFGGGGRRGDAFYGRRIAAADGRLFLAGTSLDVLAREDLGGVQSLTPLLSDAVVEHKGRVFVIGADEDASLMRFYEIGCEQ